MEAETPGYYQSGRGGFRRPQGPAFRPGEAGTEPCQGAHYQPDASQGSYLQGPAFRPGEAGTEPCWGTHYQPDASQGLLARSRFQTRRSRHRALPGDSLSTGRLSRLTCKVPLFSSTRPILTACLRRVREEQNPLKPTHGGRLQQTLSRAARTHDGGSRHRALPGDPLSTGRLHHWVLATLKRSPLSRVPH